MESIISSTYKYAIQKMEAKGGNIYTVPLIASYIQYIYNLDDNDSLFIRLGKHKEQILSSYIEAFEKQGGIYTNIIRGILIVASGDVKNGSDIINNNYLNIKVDSETAFSNKEYARNMIINSMSILKPKLTQLYKPGTIITKKKGTVIKPYELGGNVVAINGVNIIDHFGKEIFTTRQINYMLSGEKGSYVNIEYKGYDGKTITKTVQRVYPVEGYDYFVFTSDSNHAMVLIPIKGIGGYQNYYNPNRVKKNTEKEMMLMYP